MFSGNGATVSKMGLNPHCGGCVLAVPTAVWDSWQPHLGKPPLRSLGRGFFMLGRTGRPRTPARARAPCARIYVFEPDSHSAVTPSPLKVQRVILTDAESLAHHALQVAPDAAVGTGGLIELLPQRIRTRLTQWWPDFGA